MQEQRTFSRNFGSGRRFGEAGAEIGLPAFGEGRDLQGAPTKAKCFDRAARVLKLAFMEVRIKPETESRLAELASKSGRGTDDLVEDVVKA